MEEDIKELKRNFLGLELKVKELQKLQEADSILFGNEMHGLEARIEELE